MRALGKGHAWMGAFSLETSSGLLGDETLLSTPSLLALPFSVSTPAVHCADESVPEELIKFVSVWYYICSMETLNSPWIVSGSVPPSPLHYRVHWWMLCHQNIPAIFRFPTCCKEQALFTQIHLDNVWVLFFTNLHSYANPSHAWAGAVYTNCKTFPVELSSKPDKMLSQKVVRVLGVVMGISPWRVLTCVTTMKLFNKYPSWTSSRIPKIVFDRKLDNFFCRVQIGLKFSHQLILNYRLWSQPVFL